MNVAIVIPTYNEKETLPTLTEKLFGEIGPLVDELHVVIVDDSSPDGTADIARNLGEKFQKISECYLNLFIFKYLHIFAGCTLSIEIDIL